MFGHCQRIKRDRFAVALFRSGTLIMNFSAMLNNMDVVKSVVDSMRKRKHNQVVENINGNENLTITLKQVAK